MHPVLLWGGETPLIHTFGLMVLLGVLTALWFVRRDAARLGYNPEDAVSLGVETFLAGLIGSRILFVWQNWEPMFADASLLTMLNPREGGLIWYGGLLSATPMAILRARSYGFQIPRLCDLFATPCMLGLSIGRIGCLMAGDDHGKFAQEAAFYTLTFTDKMALVERGYANVPLLPSQPAMTFGTLCIFLILANLRRRFVTRPGSIAALLFVCYSTHRFMIEFIRGDSERGTVGGDWIPALKGTFLGNLSTSQGISVPVITLALTLFLLARFVAKEQPEPTAWTPQAAGPEAPPSQPQSFVPDQRYYLTLGAIFLLGGGFVVSYFYPGHAHFGVFQVLTVGGAIVWAHRDTYGYAYLIEAAQQEAEQRARGEAPASPAPAPAAEAPAAEAPASEGPAPEVPASESPAPETPAAETGAGPAAEGAPGEAPA